MGKWKTCGKVKRTRHVDWSQSLGGAVGAHGLGDVPADMDLERLLDRVGEGSVCEYVPSRIVHRLRPHVTTLAANGMEC